MKFKVQKQNKGISLIITVSIMLVLSVVSVSFVRITTNERVATNNYLAHVDAKLTAFAGMDFAIATMQSQLSKNGRIDFKKDLDLSNGAPIVQLAYPVLSNPDIAIASQRNGSNAPQDISLLLEQIHNGRFAISGKVGSLINGEVVGRYEADGNFFSLKVIDNSSTLNVNSHIAEDSNFNRQADANRVLNRIVKTLAEECGIAAGQAQLVADLIRGVNDNVSLQQPKWQDIEQLRNEVNSQFANTIADNLREKFLSNLTTEAFLDDKTGGVANSNRPINRPPTYYQEHRSPINVNNSSIELLTAVIKNIKATAVFYQNTASFENDGVFTNAFATETQLNNTPVLLTIDFSEGTIAREMADAIRTRVNTLGGIGEFIDLGDVEKFFDSFVRLDNANSGKNLNKAGNPNVFPVQAVNPANNTRFNPATVINLNAWHQACSDALKSNFNPNFIDNFWNSNSPAQRRACKGDLFFQNTPHHTTEFITFSLGPVEVSSLARVTALNGELLVSSAGITANVTFGTLLTHTSQRDFSNVSGSNNGVALSENSPLDTISTPINLLKFAVNNADLFAGAVEPKPVNPNTPSSTIFQSKQTFADEFATGNVKTQTPSKSDIPSMQSSPLRTDLNNLAHDGLVSKNVFYQNDNIRYFIETAFDNQPFAGGLSVNQYLAARNNTQPNLRSGNTINVSNIANRNGAVEFWVKLDADDNDAFKQGSNSVGVSSGMIGVTLASGFRQGIPDIDLPNFDTNFREGVQMYVYRNTLGQLRVSRLYYALCFKDSGEIYGAVKRPDIDFVNRRLARRDVVFDATNWKAHEWYHLRITWDDSSAGNDSLKLFINDRQINNFEKVDDPNVLEETSLLNEKEPLDAFFVNGFKRDQGRVGGYFHFGTDIDFIGNATIDQMISYNTENQGAINLQRYATNNAYRNEFTIPSRGEIKSIYWVSYPPFRQDTVNPSVKLTTVQLNGSLVSSVNIFTGLDGQRRELGLLNTSIPVDIDDKVSYIFTFTNSNNSIGQVNTGQLPATLDSVSLVFLHNVPKLSSLKFF